MKVIFLLLTVSGLVQTAEEWDSTINNEKEIRG